MSRASRTDAVGSGPKRPAPLRADQLLARYGYCSRREARNWLRRGRLTDRKESVVEDPGLRIDPHEALVDGEPVPWPDGLLAMLHKPVGTICSHNRAEGPSVYDLLPESWFRRQPPPAAVGRLDLDTSGLLLVTDRGDWIHRWTSPRSGWEKCYEIGLDRQPDPVWVDLFAAGTLLLRGERKPCAPARLELDPAAGPEAPGRVRLTLTEGRYHQVKRMFAACGARVTSLHRSRFGPYELPDDLAPGGWIPLPIPELREAGG